MDAATREAVKTRTGLRCEYCRLSQRFSAMAHHFEHIVAKQHGGSDETDNLLWPAIDATSTRNPT